MCPTMTFKVTFYFMKYSLIHLGIDQKGIYERVKVQKDCSYSLLAEIEDAISSPKPLNLIYVGSLLLDS